jgi:hypothetical protein
MDFPASSGKKEGMPVLLDRETELFQICGLVQPFKTKLFFWGLRFIKTS